jgi:hypothetical protein
MAVRHIRNPRTPQSMTTAANPPAVKPEPRKEALPGKGPKIHTKPRRPPKPRKALKGGIFSMTRQERSDGFGLYMCGNCRWYERPKPPREESCKECGVPECGLPCGIFRKHHGYFEPKRLGQAAVKKIDISHLDAGELMVLAYRCRKDAVAKIQSDMRKFRIGDRVQFYLNNELYFGEVARLTKRYVIIEPDEGGGEITLKPVDAEPAEDPLASGQ